MLNLQSKASQNGERQPLSPWGEGWKLPERQKPSGRLGSGSDDVGSSDVLPSPGLQDTSGIADALGRAAGGTAGGPPPVPSTLQASGSDGPGARPCGKASRPPAKLISVLGYGLSLLF